MAHFLHKIANSALIVGGGIEVNITQIRQSLTYKSQLEGIPSPQDNLKIIEQAAQTLKSYTGLDEIFIIKPAMVPVPLDILMPYDQTKETLPKITCMIKVMHHQAWRDTEMDYSELGILWFQQEFAFPIDQEVLKQMADIPFKDVCGEFGYII